MEFFKQMFIWWRGQTLGTRLLTFFRGKRVGVDGAGNIYYRHRQIESRRWVIYSGVIDASKVPPEWHAWLHNMVRNLPHTDSEATAHAWEKSPLANMTGTAAFYARPAVESTLEYEPWVPNQAKEEGSNEG